MNRVCKAYFNHFVIDFIDDILIYSKTQEEHKRHLRLILQLLRVERLYAKISECEFWLKEVQFLGHTVNELGIHDDPSKIEAVKNWIAPKYPSEIRLFLGLAGYYHCFISNFSKIVVPLTSLTQKDKPFVWGPKQKESFQTLKDMLCNAPILTHPDGNDDFVVYRDASNQGKANVVANALSRTTHVKGIRCFQLIDDLRNHIREAQYMFVIEGNLYNEMQCGAE
ncbi:uncharacterized mitochondrial protein AtMg00860-like [Helianthus annuus]|uniref:uncharacterized mitochondrial protein AtMg00860-like n=1 Tax=Helianthus annuus TaxID=4232 RepID=UPI000B905CB1|nr:uncharacterized mitochondrial protein AtMg00860-like [Helianthus annuus]